MGGHEVARVLESPADFRGVFRTDLLARAMYAEGAGIARCVPTGVAVPADADDVPTLMRWSKREGVALMPRGSGSGMAGGAVGAARAGAGATRRRHVHPARTRVH